MRLLLFFMEKESIYLSVIVPAYNEGHRGLTENISAMVGYLEKQPYSYEIVIVNDGSQDNTIEVAREIARINSHIRILDSQPNHGKGFVVRKGMLEASGSIRLITDADNSTTLDHFEKMKPLFDAGYGVVIASRNPRDARGAQQAQKQSILRRLAGHAGNLLIQIVAVPGIWDTQCGFKAFRSDAAENIFSRALINRWGWDVEALALARKLKYKIGKIPAHWINKEGGTVSFKAYLGVFKDTFLVRKNILRGAYHLKKK